MNFINPRKILNGACLSLVCLLTVVADVRAVSLYSETFSGQDGKGWIDTGPLDLAGVAWEVDLSGADFSDHADNDFGVVSVSGEEQFRGSDTDGVSRWLSPVIDISGHANVALSLEARETGSLEGADVFSLKYVLDGGPEVLVSALSDDFGSDFTTLGRSGLGGSSLRVIVEIENNSTSENHYFDNVEVTGDRLTASVPDGGTTCTLLAIGLAGVAATRRSRR